jgi:uncharacterized paraquat-inducible protein A
MSIAAVPLRQQRCVNHPAREASARCPECGRFYCRECVTEHDDRLLCASCLAKLAEAARRSRGRRLLLVRLLLVGVSFGVIFLLFLLLGSFLISIPSKFHAEGW